MELPPGGQDPSQLFEMSGVHLSSESAALEGIVADNGDIVDALDGRQEVCAHGDIIEALEGREKVCAHSDIIGALEGRQEVCAHSDIIGALREGRRYVHHFCGPLSHLLLMCGNMNFTSDNKVITMTTGCHYGNRACFIFIVWC